MTTQQTSGKARVTAAIATCLIAGMVVVWLMLTHLQVSQNLNEWPPHHNTQIELQEFVDFADFASQTSAQSTEPAPAYAEAAGDNQSQEAAAEGSDAINQGATGDAAPAVSSALPSPVKVEKKPDAKQLAAENKRKEEETIRRATTSKVSGAFTNSGKHNATNGAADKANAGTPSGTTAGNALKGSGTGSVGGGWVMPRYNTVPSTVTGSIKMTVRVDVTGKVTSVTITGGEAPAATDPQVRAACEKEVRAHRFTRPASAPEATEAATAYITYIFK